MGLASSVYSAGGWPVHVLQYGRTDSPGYSDPPPLYTLEEFNMAKFDRPGQFPTWRALRNEIICNLFRCRWIHDHRPIYTGGIVLHVPTKYCARCRRSIG